MPPDLDDRDALAWWEHRASLLRRVARGERENLSSSNRMRHAASRHPCARGST
jgi:inactivated superfamily I helicase